MNKLLFKPITYILLVSAFNIIDMHCQNLNKHRWKNRVVLIISKTVGNVDLNDQGLDFRTQPDEFKNRKLFVYQILPELYRRNTAESKWRYSKDPFTTHNPENAPFKIVLIGLDGKVKLEKYTRISNSELFEVIDSMPMRQSELINKKN